MIEFQKKTLDNGLRVIVHQDKTTPMAAVNVCYNIGSRDEDPDRTGFAHLFEHLMFGGSKHIADYDTPIQKVGGENNAFTSNDITNYYITLPANNIETAFWLESDRMLELDFSEKSLDVQKSVVIEEFKQRTLNQPYGDIYSIVRELSYKEHPYQWPTIGKEISHIEEATLDMVKDFFYSHYAPNNAVLVVGGNVDAEEIFALAEKWFGDIPMRKIKEKNFPQEPAQTEARFKTVHRDVPYSAIYMSFHMDGRFKNDFFTTDLISDILSNGQSSRMYKHLVVEQRIFNELDAYITADSDPGLFIIAGKPADDVSMEDAEAAIWKELNTIATDLVGKYELEKVINKAVATLVYTEIGYLNKSMSLAQCEIMGDANLVNKQLEGYQSVTAEAILENAKKMFQPSRCSTVYYLKNEEKK